MPSRPEELHLSMVSTNDPELQATISSAASALKRMADYELSPSLDRRMHELGEQKEFLAESEHEELLALVDFTHKRTIERLEALAVLDRIRVLFPDCASNP